MTVAQMIEELQKLPPDFEVVVYGAGDDAIWEKADTVYDYPDTRQVLIIP